MANNTTSTATDNDADAIDPRLQIDYYTILVNFANKGDSDAQKLLDRIEGKIYAILAEESRFTKSYGNTAICYDGI